MNPASSYVEPKFPPTEEYSANDYIHSAGAHDGFYGSAALHHQFGYDARRYGGIAAESPYTSTGQPHHGYGVPSAATPPGTTPINLSNGTLGHSPGAGVPNTPNSYHHGDSRTSPNSSASHGPHQRGSSHGGGGAAGAGHTTSGAGGASGPPGGPSVNGNIPGHTNISPEHHLHGGTPTPHLKHQQQQEAQDNNNRGSASTGGVLYPWMTKSHAKSKNSNREIMIYLTYQPS